MKRIVEETLANGEKQFRVEKNTCFFGLIKCEWYTDTKPVGLMGEFSAEAIFNNIEDAEIFVFGNPKSKEVVKRKIIEY